MKHIPNINDGCLIIIDGVHFKAVKIDPNETNGKHCVFYGIHWYELVMITPKLPPMDFITAKKQRGILLLKLKTKKKKMPESKGQGCKISCPEKRTKD